MQAIPGSRLCSYHRCECGREKKSSNDSACQYCLANRPGKRQSPLSPAPNNRLPGGRFGGPTPIVKKLGADGKTTCARQGCNFQAITGQRFCVHHGCRCGKEKSSNDRVCTQCAGGLKSLVQRPGGRADREEEEMKALMAALRIDNPGEDSPPFDLEAELESIVGMAELKEAVRDLQHQIRLDMRRGVLESKSPLHMIFTGNPGTGKTSVARLMAKMLHHIGYLETPRLVEVQRADLVAEYVGQTAIKTKRVIRAARGGVLFVDEAYRLCNTTGKDFGPEAIEELMAVMTDSDIVVILAGYPSEMQDFVETNPGLFRRIRCVFHFPDYDCKDLAEIFMKYVEKRKFDIERGVKNVEAMSKLFEMHTTPEQRARMNAGIVEHIFEGAKKALDRSIHPDDPNPSVTLCKSHIIDGMRGVKTPPPPRKAIKPRNEEKKNDPPVAFQ